MSGSKLNLKPYKGCRDFFPVAMRTRNYLFSKMNESAELFAFEPYDGPLLEEVELYKAKSGEELINDQIYSFNDRGERFVAIRPEMTPTLARMVAQVINEVPKPLRLYSIPNLMRYERPQRGRLREHWQFNCDIFGTSNGKGEHEIISLIINLMENFGADQSHFKILFNDRRLVNLYFHKILKINEEQSLKLYKIMDKAKKIKPEQLKEEVTSLFEGNMETSNLAFNYLTISSISEFINLFNANQIELDEEIISLYKLLSTKKIKEFLKFDPTIVRGLDYYTGLVFEVFDLHPDNKRAIAGGGAYANLLSIFNKPNVPAVGFGMGDVTLTDFLESHNLLPDQTKNSIDVFINVLDEDSYSFAANLASLIRNNKIKVELYPEPIKPKKAFNLITKKEVKHLIIIGENEVSTNQVDVKNLQTKETNKFDIENTEELNQLIETLKDSQ
ncbi:histidine--tRNA ligase [Bacteriovoracaceae bacterium]|nr:histidine--tRNA ligase [Bacteriovoracaceae bacterium]